MKDFNINTNKIKIANSKSEVSHTIEELLRLNKLIPAHTNKEKLEVIENQLNNEDYINKPSRGEKTQITEIQFGERDGKSIPIQEIRLEEAEKTNGGHEKEEESNERVRGHKKSQVPKIWLEVYKKEDDRKKDSKIIENKIKTKTAQKLISLPSNIKNSITKDIDIFLHDGLKMKYFDEIPLSELFDTLSKYGLVAIQEDNTEWSGFMTGREGHAEIPLSPIKTGKEQNGEMVYENCLNNMFCIQWYKMESGKYEINVYIS